MKRRRLLTLIAGLGLTSGSVWFIQKEFPSENTSLFPITVETIDARGSKAEQLQIPIPNIPTVIDLFATWCNPCKKQMKTLNTVHNEYVDKVAFVSVTNERIGGTLSKNDIREWWRNHNGDWTVGFDPGSNLMAALRADGLPYLAIFDASGTLQWEHGGITNTSTLRNQIDQVLNTT